MKTRGWLWMLTALTVPALAGCVDEDAGPTTVSGAGAIKVGFDFVVLDLPGGDVTVAAGVAELDTATYPNDLFGRAAPSRDPVFVQAGDLDIDKTTDWSAPRFWFDDPRLPALIPHTYDDTYGDNIDWIEFQRPDAASKIDRWDYRSDIDYVGEDDSWYAVGLARYAVQVNGLVDHLEILVNDGVVAQPDSLILLGGSPGGYPDHQADFWLSSGDSCPPVPAGANPFILGHFKTGPNGDPKDPGANFNGETDADFCFLGSGQWQSGYTNPLHPDSIPFAPNNFESFDLPQYNYLVIWEFDKATNTVLYDRPFMRAQVGVELDLNGNPVPHAFAPLPTAPGKELSEFASYAEFLADPRVAAGARSIDLIINNLKPLAAGESYQIWLYDEVEGDAVRISPDYVLQRPDTVGVDDLGEPIIQWVNVGDTASVQGFDGAMGMRHVILVDAAALQAGGVDVNQYTHAVITIGGSADASPADSPAPVWYRYANQNGTRADLFDNEVFLSGSAEFGFVPSLADQGKGWQPFGTGTVQFLNVEGIAVGLDRLARPPLGYYYAVWLVNQDDGTKLSLGEITTPPPDFESLRDADIQTGEFVTQGEIFAAVKWAQWADLGSDPSSFTHVYVTLEPKDGSADVMSPTVIFQAPIPKGLDKMPKEHEAS